MANPCNTALVIVAHERVKELERALKSIKGVVGRGRDIEKLYIVDTSPSPNDGEGVSRAVGKFMGQEAGRLTFSVLRLPGATPAAARNAAFWRFAGAMGVDSGLRIDQVFCLDDDDTHLDLGAYAREMHRLYRRSGFDIVVPSMIVEVSAEDRDSKKRQGETYRELAIPESRQDIDGWVKLARVGAVFGYSTQVLQRVGGFNPSWEHDEWVDFIGRALMLGATVGHAELPINQSYVHTTYGPSDPHSARRLAHENGAADRLRAIFAGQVPLRANPAFQTQTYSPAPAASAPLPNG